MAMEIGEGPTDIEVGDDGAGYRWTLNEGHIQRTIDVYLTGTLSASSPELLPSQVGQALATSSRSVIEACLSQAQIPEAVYVSTVDIAAVARASVESAVAGEEVFVPAPSGLGWVKGVVERPGLQSEALDVDDPRVVAGRRGPGKRGEDVVWVRRLDDNVVEAFPYRLVRRRWRLV